MTLLARGFGNDKAGREPTQELPRLRAAQNALAIPEPLFLAGPEAVTRTRGPMSAELPLCVPRLRTDLHSPAGVRPKFRHSLEHIVPGKEPRLPGKELRPAGLPLPSQACSSRTSPGRGVQAGGERVTWARGAEQPPPPHPPRRGRPFSPAVGEPSVRGMGYGGACATLSRQTPRTRESAALLGESQRSCWRDTRPCEQIKRDGNNFRKISRS